MRRWRGRQRRLLNQRHRRSGSVPWLPGLLTLVTSAAWFGLLLLPNTLKHGADALVPIVAAAGLAIAVGSTVEKWSARRNWTDQHRLAVVLGALPVSMCFGLLVVTAGNRMDQAGQAAGCLITLVLLALLAWRLRGAVVLDDAVHH